MNKNREKEEWQEELRKILIYIQLVMSRLKPRRQPPHDSETNPSKNPQAVKALLQHEGSNRRANEAGNRAEPKEEEK